ncbi:hypothetical protein CE91St41_09170 [Oscillospiraceae bacterium]|nr:hypothetical protein CE91St40_28360 [Oscillospiraceae bacterium]BDF74028.1 hypothetical protein CE91St41_09170 [Oscillospiraceae bacterium]
MGIGPYECQALYEAWHSCFPLWPPYEGGLPPQRLGGPDVRGHLDDFGRSLLEKRPPARFADTQGTEGFISSIRHAGSSIRFIEIAFVKRIKNMSCLKLSVT